jgi:hypothetical protein
VVVINQAFAKKYFHGDNPLGHELQFGSHVQPRPMQILGVAGYVKYGKRVDVGILLPSSGHPRHHAKI